MSVSVGVQQSRLLFLALYGVRLGVQSGVLLGLLGSYVEKVSDSFLSRQQIVGT